MDLYKGLITIIMPAYNESGHIYNNLAEAHLFFRRSKCRFEIIVVDDGSEDDTYKESLRASRDLEGIKVVHYPFNNGKGNALKEGFGHAAGDYVVFLDSDLDLHPSQLCGLFRIMRDEQAQVVVGSKSHALSKLNYPAGRKALSKVYAFVLRLMFGLPLRDTQTGLKVFKKEVLDRVFPRVLCKRYAFDVELLANAHRAGYKVVEAPVVLNYRRQMRWGRIGFKDVYRMAMDTLAIYYRMHILRYYDQYAEDGEAVDRG